MQKFKQFFSDLINGMSVIPGSDWGDYSHQLNYFIELTPADFEALLNKLENAKGDVFEYNGMLGSIAGNRLMLSKKVDVGFSGDFKKLVSKAKSMVEKTVHMVAKSQDLIFPLECGIDSTILNLEAYKVAEPMFVNLQTMFIDHYKSHCAHAAIDELVIERRDDMFKLCFGKSPYNVFKSFDDLDHFCELLNWDVLINYLLIRNDIENLNQAALNKHGERIIDPFCYKRDFKLFSKFNFGWVYESYSYSGPKKFDRWKSPDKFKSLAFILRQQGHDQAAQFFTNDVLRKIDSGFCYGDELVSPDLGISVKAMKEVAQVKLPKMMIRAIAVYLNKYCAEKLMQTVDLMKARGQVK